MMENTPRLTDIPEVLEKIIGYLSYDEIAKKRLVCKSFDVTCQRLLNRGFLLMEKRHHASIKAVKAKLPRRESERRTHPLARHSDILTSIETRISMLSMTYTKYIDQKLCCFIPGKVIDEILRVLRLLEVSQTPPRAHEVLQELRDISSMAIEHFDEKISPKLRQSVVAHTSNSCVPQAGPFNLSLNIENQPRSISHTMLSSAFNKMTASAKINEASTALMMKKTIGICQRLKKTCHTVLKQQKIIQEQNMKIEDQGAKIADLRRRIDEWDAKYREITANINQINTLENKPTPGTSKQIETIKPLSAVFASLSAAVPKISNIKPRSATITLKRSAQFDLKKEDEKKIRKK